MQQRLIELHQQRGRLLERVAMQRNALAQDVQPLARMFDLSARVQGLLQQARIFVVDHPFAMALALGALFVFRPSAVVRWGQRSLFLWRGWKTLRAVAPALVSKYLGGLL